MLEAWRAGPDDVHTVTAITRAAYAPYTAALGAEPVPMTEDHAALVAAGEVFLFGRPGAVRGLCVVSVQPDHLGVESLAVVPAFHGQGLGRFMLGWAELQAMHLRLPELRLLTNDRMTRNVAIYRRFGFTETVRLANPKRPGWISVHMAKPVSA